MSFLSGRRLLFVLLDESRDIEFALVVFRDDTQFGDDAVDQGEGGHVERRIPNSDALSGDPSSVDERQFVARSFL